MAVQTAFILIQRLMVELNGLCLGADIFVAFETQFIAGFVKNKTIARSMGVVAGDAIAFNDVLVGAARFLRYLVFVAAAAQRCHI